MSEWIYNKQVELHFMSPKNILMVSEEEYNADGVGTVGSAACGDMMKVFIKVTDNTITDMKWKTYGCASAIASTSALSEILLDNGGMTLEKAYKLTPEDIIKKLEGLPNNKIHCSVLGDKALRVAINNYFERKNIENPFGSGKSKIICDCVFKTEDDIKMEVLEGITDAQVIKERTGAGLKCGHCAKRVENVVKHFVDKYHADDLYNPKGSD